MDLASTRGTRDFYPEQMRLQKWLMDHFRQTARLFGFEEYDAPVVEAEELYTRKAGEEIVQQLYAFEDKSGRRLALRPEMTPSLARLVMGKGRSLALPVKWFSIPQCWRYERMTRGRRREHYQLNLDIFGVSDQTAEIELIRAVVHLMEAVGLNSADVGINVSNRKLLQGTLTSIGVADEQFGAICVLVDKLEKVPQEVVRGEMEALGLDRSQAERIVDLLSMKSLEDLSAVLGEDQDGIRELRELFGLADAYELTEWLQFDASLVRGLAYYTGTVFEAFDRGNSLRAICGGGRYDRLLSAFGGDDLPACGFGFGDAVIMELLDDKGLVPALTQTLDDVVFPFDPSLRPAAMSIAAQLRRQGRSVDLILENKKLKWALKRADACGASRLVLLAPDEWSAGRVRVKDMASGAEEDVIASEL